ncbi:hypothetical protein F5X68DRAFT_69646 [Plectosphaerella plurivora]|uniref:Uncharacterized protein n=1 Tax=Plectosphaerella plurivora TaxID=936078 RepID=A0A9P9ACB8_9PEZI|nr:hypothetical protein F5X68DRAFT_69646 [Plectosphaerella plurivora]
MRQTAREKKSGTARRPACDFGLRQHTAPRSSAHIQKSLLNEWTNRCSGSGNLPYTGYTAWLVLCWYRTYLVCYSRTPFLPGGRSGGQEAGPVPCGAYAESRPGTVRFLPTSWPAALLIRMPLGFSFRTKHGRLPDRWSRNGGTQPKLGPGEHGSIAQRFRRDALEPW